MRTAYICESPLHLFLCVWHAGHNKTEKDEYDLYLLNELGARAERTYPPEETGLFTNVVRYDPAAWKVNPAVSAMSGALNVFGKKDKYDTFKKKTAYAHFVRRARRMSGGSVSSKRMVSYDRIMSPAGTNFTIAMSVINPQAEIVYYEDGTGSYHEDMYSGFHTEALREKLRSCGMDPEDYRPDKLMVAMPEYCTGGTAKENVKYEMDDCKESKIRDALTQTFGERKSTIYKERKIVYFPQKIQEIGGDDEKINDRSIKICETIDDIGTEFVIRPHPRDKNISWKSNNGVIDQVGEQWECICMDDITDDHILIGSYSTAQFTPKFYFDKEPWVI
nr:hypothetical protein [Lachnospiraceae bacterium]